MFIDSRRSKFVLRIQANFESNFYNNNSNKKRSNKSKRNIQELVNDFIHQQYGNIVIL